MKTSVRRYRIGKYRRLGFVLLESLVMVFLFFLVYHWIQPFNIDKSYSTLVTDKDGQVLHAFLSEDDKWRMYIEPEEISPLLEETFLAKEDKYFYYHPGVNPFALARAFFNNVFKGKRTSGASTITMQVIRLNHPRARTYSNKLIEIIESFRLEMAYSKREILNLYLNMVPYGGNIEGVKSVAVLCLDKLPEKLSLSECVALSIIPNRPNSLKPGKNNDKINESKNIWLRRFKKKHLFKDNIIEDALNEDFIGKRRPSPKRVPHLAWRLKRANPHKYNIQATLENNVQSKTEKIARNYSQGLSYRGIHNVSVMIIDNSTWEVVGYLGSSDFYDEDHAGQVDGVRAIRSPGSTLKPFLYGLAMDRGLITPRFQLMDVPLNVQGYEPENYDGDFHGSVTTAHALAHSLNIPSVRLLDQYTTKAFIEDLIKADFKQINRDRNKLGLSMILGGCGVTLEELCGLYAGMANQGVKKKLIFQQSQTKESTEDSLLSPEADYLLSTMLLDVSRPDLPDAWRNTLNMPAIAWKTGTSYGRKDAWSIGYTKEYTIGVWVGNFDNKGVPDMSGANSAAPLLFSLFNAIQTNNSQNWLRREGEIDYRQVCSVTGKVPGEYCEKLVVDDYLPGISSTVKCDHIRRIWVNPDSTMSYCLTCRPEVGYVEALYPHYPNEMVDWYENKNINYQKIPVHNPDCERIFYDDNPRIISPINSLTYYLDIVDSMEVALACQVYNDVNKVYWYVNDRFLKEAKPTERVFIFPKKGRLTITCVDDKGRKTSVDSYVKYSNF